MPDLPENFKTCGVFLLPKNPKLYADHFFYHGTSIFTGLK